MAIGDDPDDGTSYFLTLEVARRAIETVRPMIEAMMASGQVKRKDLYVVILDPAELMDFDSAILCQETWGDQITWEHDYVAIAQGKAFLAWRERQSARTVRTEEPWLILRGDVKFVGSVAFGRTGSLIVAASGVQDYYDEFISLCIAGAIQALCREAVLNDTSEGDFYR